MITNQPDMEQTEARPSRFQSIMLYHLLIACVRVSVTILRLSSSALLSYRSDIPYLFTTDQYSKQTIMPSESSYPPVDIPDVGLWDFLFAPRELPFPEDKSERTVNYLLRCVLILCPRDLHRRPVQSIIHLCPSQGHRNRIWAKPSRSMGLAER
jgi:hypothetical protein